MQSAVIFFSPAPDNNNKKLPMTLEFPPHLGKVFNKNFPHDAPALLKWANVGVVKGVTAKQSWFVSTIFHEPMSRNTPEVFEEEAYSCHLGSTGEKQTSAFGASKVFPQEVQKI